MNKSVTAAAAIMAATGAIAMAAQEEEFDINLYEDVLSGKVFIRNPATGQPTKLYIEFAGPEHPDRKKRTMNAQREMRAHLQKTGKLKLKDPLEDEEDGIDTLVACALGWNLPHEFTSENVRKVLDDKKKRWLRDQMQVGFDDRENFIGRSVNA